MTVKRRILDTSLVTPTIEQIINKGGKTTQESSSEMADQVRFTLCLPKSLLKKIEENRKSRPGKISRNQWILETLTEKLI